MHQREKRQDQFYSGKRVGLSNSPVKPSDFALDTPVGTDFFFVDLLPVLFFCFPHENAFLACQWSSL